MIVLGNNVVLWTRSKDVAASINEKHVNPKYLSNITLSSNLSAVSELSAELFAKVTVVLISIPTQHAR